MTSGRPANRERGASAVEYGLLVAGVVAAFLIGAVGLQAAVGAVMGQQVTHIQNNDVRPLPAGP
jgi:Flp pilus assembly pilin Flp